MKLLLCVSSLADIETTLQYFSFSPQLNSALPFISSGKILHHETDILETSVGVYQTTYKLTKALSAQKYHLALKVSFANAYKIEIGIGSVLNIINEKPGDYGMMVNNEWVDQYDAGLINREHAPHVRGGLVNMTNAYMNVFAPYKKSVGISVNHYADKNSLSLRTAKYKADCETGDGVGFTYPCLFEKQSFYHLAVAERNLVTGEENFHLARVKMNETLTDILQKL